MKLWLDDIRTPPKGWVWAKTCLDAVRLLDTEKVTEVSFDHDLGEHTACTGYDVVSWLEEAVMTRGLVPPRVLKIHSANPVGRKNMEAAITNIQDFMEER